MKFSNFATVIVLTGATAFLSACGGSNSTVADEAAIKDINKKWQELIVAKDAKAIAELYVEDGEMLPPNLPKAVGRAAIEQGWNGFTSMPGMALTFETDKLVFAQSGDIAVETGTYKFSAGEGAAQTTEVGKSVVTWQKKDGKWHVLTDMFSSDTAPTPPAAPAAPVDATVAPADGAAVPADATAPATSGTAAPATPAAPTTTPAAPAAPATPPAH